MTKLILLTSLFTMISISAFAKIGCYSDSDCPWQFTCDIYKQTCNPGTADPIKGGCFSDSDCPKGFTCEVEKMLCIPGIEL